MERTWLKHYPTGVPPTIDTTRYGSLVDLIDESFTTHARLPAYKFMGREVSFEQVNALSALFAAWLQGQGFVKGDRLAIMMPNVPQYPVVVAAALRAGLVVVNVNPLYTPRELEHQLLDSEVCAIVVFENFAHVLQKCIDKSEALRVQLRQIVTASIGDLLGRIKGTFVNVAVRRIKKMVPAYRIAGAIGFNDALAVGGHLPRYEKPDIDGDDIALLQYTGGTTGVAKGAVLLHRNLVANVLQSEAWNEPAFRSPTDAVARPGAGAVEQFHFVCALPLYHIYAFTVVMMLCLRLGNCSILIPNPRDITATLKELRRHRFHCLPAVNTLFNAIVKHDDFDSVDWRHLRLSLGGGSSVTQATAKLWLAKTGSSICEGYGLSETSPSASCNPTDAHDFTGTIGMPLPSTDFKLVDNDGNEVAPGEVGEIAVKGPQVMAGYWKRPDETAQSMTADGFFRTGDIGSVDERGYFKIVDRKKDMILVSGFNVYPNEIEDVVSAMPGVQECAVIGMPDEKTGEAVRLFVVREDPLLTEQAVRAYCTENLTRYKRPKKVEFRDELPKTPVGKVLRRELR